MDVDDQHIYFDITLINLAKFGQLELSGQI